MLILDRRSRVFAAEPLESMHVHLGDGGGETHSRVERLRKL